VTRRPVPQNPDWFYLSGAPAHLGSPGKGPLNGCVCVCVCVLVISETGSPITGTCVGLGSELYLDGGVAGKPVPGFDGQSFLLCLWRGAVTVINVCVFVSPLAYLKNHLSKFYKIPRFTPGRSLVHPWRQWTALRTSGFLDDVMFSHDRTYRRPYDGHCRRAWYIQHNLVGRLSNSFFKTSLKVSWWQILLILCWVPVESVHIQCLQYIV